MKKKLKRSGDASVEQQSTDYVVGQVSESLFQENPSGSGSLTALFSTAGAVAPLVFQAAPKPVQKSTEKKQQQKDSEVKGQPSQNQKPPKDKSAADKKLVNRESSLQKADEDEQALTTSAKRKRKAPSPCRENDVEDWVMKRQRLKARREEEALKRKRTIFVGNLPISCTKKTLRSLFKDKGSIETIRFRSVVREDQSMSRKVAAIKRKIHPKRQSVNAYIVFKDEEGAAGALDRNGMEMEKDVYIRVDRVRDSSSHDHKRSIFVGNLSFEMNELTLRRHFEECGTVEAVRLVRDQNSGLGKGFGYVLFESSDSVQLALKLDGSKVDGRSIRVKRSVKKEKSKSGTRGTTGRTSRGPGRGPAKGPVQGSGKKLFGGNQQRSTLFKGEVVDPKKKTKKRQKKKTKPKKTIHI
ncbi:RNA-binding protein 34 [Betta splendens]|uniref:RNA-binding protein 34 n=1 Tax=Betta splendens TaxID=158456 RepID=A0A6P7MVT3_BETSP|nr:RNA-binding protein 34 [Betta splendens]